MDIKRQLSPQLGDDLIIRIYFGEVQSNANTNNSMNLETGVNLGGRGRGGGSGGGDGETKTSDIELTHMLRGQYQGVPKDDEKKVVVLEDSRDGAL